MVSASYFSLSPISNMGNMFLLILVLPTLHTLLRLINLLIYKKRTRLARIQNIIHHLSLNMSIHTYINLQVGSQIISLTSVFIYLRYSSTFYSTTFISATRLLSLDMYASIFLLFSNLALSVGLCVVTIHKGWWKLELYLKYQRGWYTRIHQEIMNDPETEKYQRRTRHKSETQMKLNTLEARFNKREARFDELHQIIGSDQCENLYPSAIGFNRSIYHLLMKWFKPLPVALITVFVDVKWVGVLSVFCFMHFYYMVELMLIRSKNGVKWSTFCLLITINYVQLIIMVCELPITTNYVGWAYIGLL